MTNKVSREKKEEVRQISMDCGICTGIPIDSVYEIVEQEPHFIIVKCTKCGDTFSLLLKVKEAKK